jgi:hypothetical protein
LKTPGSRPPWPTGLAGPLRQGEVAAGRCGAGAVGTAAAAAHPLSSF